MEKFKVTIPATSANIGVGYDCLGVALDYYLELEVTESEKIEFVQDGEDFSIPIEENYIYTTIKLIEEKYNKKIPNYKVEILKNEIPTARGLGSSSSAIVAGLLIANRFLSDFLGIEDIAKLATEIEGHPDNVLPAIFGGMVLALPYIIWELWRFISPALHPKERKNSSFVINFVWILFLIGALVGYYLILPLAINFGMLFTISDSITQLFDLSDYTTLFLQVVLGMGLVFLFPVVVYFLTTIGILTPVFLKTYRRHAIVVIMVVAAIVTPADVFSMLAAAFPLLVLYEFSVLMSIYVYKKIQKAEQKELAKRKS